jgi:tetratricopeptide (TPR) repeat protein
MLSMMIFQKRICLPIVVLAIGLIASPVTAAPRKTDTETASAMPNRASELRDKGIVALNLGRYEEAVKLLEEAYELSRESAVLFDLVQAHRLNGNPERALVLCAAFLRSRPTLTPRNREEIERTVAELGIIVEEIRLQGKAAKPSKTPVRMGVEKEIASPEKPPASVPPPAIAEVEPPAATETETEGLPQELAKEKEEIKKPLPSSAAKPIELAKTSETVGSAELLKNEPAPIESKSRFAWLRSPWFLTAAGVVVAGVVALVVYESTKDPGAPHTSWGTQKVF